ncbi:MAG: hypothetical protein KatS3mg006_1293 [Pyrinomonadaceae bacterium]|nr:MAG: hypothetical protein KatS3mg006_1293 [Pyrinomonadaceae bacterium]
MKVFFRRFSQNHPYLAFFMSGVLSPVSIFMLIGLYFILRVPLYAYPCLWLALNPIKVSDSVELQPGVLVILWSYNLE